MTTASSPPRAYAPQRIVTYLNILPLVSPTIVLAEKVLGRDLALFAVVAAFPPTRTSLWVLVMFSAWATSEVIR